MPIPERLEASRGSSQCAESYPTKGVSTDLYCSTVKRLLRSRSWSSTKALLIQSICLFSYVSTTDAIIHAIEKWPELLDKRPNAEVEVIFKNFRKAFHKMQPSQLNRKPNELRVAADIRQLVLNFLEERHQRVRVQNSKSNYEQIQKGVRTARNDIWAPVLVGFCQ